MSEQLVEILQKQSVFITGGAGVGKTYLTRQLLTELKDEKIIQCGPTGVSAINLPNGQTLHSAFGLPVGKVPPLHQWGDISAHIRDNLTHNQQPLVEQTQQAKYLLIDEISMCSAMMLEYIDVRIRIWRNQPDQVMGGLILICVGDFLQLPPVNDSTTTTAASDGIQKRMGMFAFESPVWYHLNFHVVELETVHRQDNQEFIKILQKIRWSTPLNDSEKQILQQHVVGDGKLDDENVIQIMVKREDVFHTNQFQLAQLTTPMNTYRFPFMPIRGNGSRDLISSLYKDVRQTLYLKHDEKFQQFRRGARVMLIVNDLKGTQLVNGDRGWVIGFLSSSFMASGSLLWYDKDIHGNLLDFGRTPVVVFDRYPDKFVVVNPWMFEKSIGFKGSPLLKKKTSQLIAFPLCLAWASTVHKVQGCTITGRVHIICDLMDILPGTFYVALSRITQLENLSMTKLVKQVKSNQTPLLYYQKKLFIDTDLHYRISQSMLRIVMKYYSSSSSSSRSKKNKESVEHHQLSKRLKK